MTMTLIPLTDLCEDSENLRVVYDPDQLAEMATSIEAVGLINPLTVRKSGDKWMVVAGHRRLRALRSIHKKSEFMVPCIVDDADRQRTTAVMLVENLQRVDLDPIEEAKGYLRLTTEFGLKPKQLASTVGRKLQHVMDRLALLQLPDEVQAKIGDGLSLESAVRLTKITDPKKRQELVKDAAKGKLQSWSIDSALRSQQKAEDEAKLTKELAKSMLTVYGSMEDAGISWHEVEFITGLVHGDVKGYVAQSDHVLVRRGPKVDVYRRRTEEEMAARARGRDVAETPHDLWMDARSDWMDECQDLRARQWQEYALLVAGLPESTLRFVVAELAAYEAVLHEDARPSYNASRKIVDWLSLPDPSEETPTPPSVLVARWMEAEPQQIGRKLVVWVLRHALRFPNLEASPHLWDRLRVHLEELSLLQMPVFETPEPWQDDAGVWVTDRPAPVEEGDVSPDEHLESAYEDLTYVDYDDEYGEEGWDDDDVF